MKVLVLGSGAREHAIVWKLSKSNRITGLFAAPGNAGTAALAKNVDVDIMDGEAVCATAASLGADLVFIGPEGPLAAGVADALRAAGSLVFGPGASSARLESSKSFARALMERYGIPCAKSARFERGQYHQFKKYVDDCWRKGAARLVVKKSGLAAGKGVLEAREKAEALSFGEAVLKDDEAVVEEFLSGWELSLFAVCDEESYVLLPPCADHKKAGEGDTGPNTGGMGAICPVPPADRALMAGIDRDIVAPTFKAMKKEGLTYRGVLFFGIMVTESGPKLLEYNVRFGDPETQSLLPLLKTDFLDLAEAAARGRVKELSPEFSDESAVGIVVAAPGYPDAYPKGLAVESAALTSLRDAVVFHASTSVAGDGTLRTGGGRCFTAVGMAGDLLAASAVAYEAAKRVRFEGAWFRSDIGRKFYGELP
jgi:phosphoribosylamine---glycine ligase